MKSIFAALLLGLGLTISSYAQDANRILEGARLSAALTKLDEGLSGHLNHNGKKVPITIFLKGKNIQFQFQEGGKWKIFHLKLANDQYDIFEIVNGKAKIFPKDRITESIAGTDLTYEDLALRFFYWPNPKLVGTESIKTMETYKLRLTKPANSSGNYFAVYAWIHTKFGAFMKIKGHGKNGELLKEFQVEDVMKVSKGVWTLRKMQVSTFKNDRRVSITDMILEEPSKKAVQSLR